MAQIDDYERRGDLDAQFELTRQHEKAQRDAENLQAAARRAVEGAPPLTLEQRERISQLLGTPTPPRQLMTWRLRLYCGHVVERTAHYTHKTLHNAFTGSTSCPECGLAPATVVDAEAVGLAPQTPAAAAARQPTPVTQKVRKPTKAELEAKAGRPGSRGRPAPGE
ncbi:hypothetical protein ACQP1U_06190 [Actinomycetota bacterium]